MLEETQVRKWFFDAVSRNPNASSDLKASMKKNKMICENYIKLLHKELIKVDALRRNQKKKELEGKTFKWFTEEMADNFVVAIEKQANKNMSSDLEKLRIKAEQDKQKELEDASEGKFTGEFKELIDDGALIVDETQLQRR